MKNKITNICPKCKVDLVERQGAKFTCYETECKGIVLSIETLKEFAKNKLKMKNIHRINGEIYITAPQERFKKEELITDGIDIISASSKVVDAQDLIGRRNWQKIIMTSDKQLDVQQINSSVLSFLAENPECDNLDVDLKLLNPLGRVVDPNNINQNHSSCKWTYRVFLPYKEHKKLKSIQEYSDLYNEEDEILRSNIVSNFLIQKKHSEDLGLYETEEKLYTKKELLEHLNLLYFMKNSLVDTLTDENGVIIDKWFAQFD